VENTLEMTDAPTGAGTTSLDQPTRCTEVAWISLADLCAFSGQPQVEQAWTCEGDGR